MDYKKVKKTAKEVWHFIWESDSPWSWLANIVLAFIIIKFLVYPALGFMLSTSYPIVAVVSGSMEHKLVNPCDIRDSSTGECIEYDKNTYEICGKDFEENHWTDFDFFWQACGDWYEHEFNIQKGEFKEFPMHNGFNTGDIIILRGSEPQNIKIGDIIVYSSYIKPDPIIHRVVDKKESKSKYIFQTKGDHNDDSGYYEQSIGQDQILGKAWVRVPFLGYVKIWFINFLELTRILDLVRYIRG